MTYVRGAQAPIVDQVTPADVLASGTMTTTIASIGTGVPGPGTVYLSANMSMEAPNTTTLRILQGVTTLDEKTAATSGERTGESMQVSAAVTGGETHSVEVTLAGAAAQDIRDITFTRIFIPA